MRIARGIQNKVLEGMAMARTVVVSAKGLEGISARQGREVLVAGSPEETVAALLTVMRGRVAGLGAAARAMVQRDYCWDANARRFLELVDGASSSD
jgi:hypothetical protein